MSAQQQSNPRKPTHRKPWTRRQYRIALGVIILFSAPIVLVAAIRVISDRHLEARFAALRAGGFPTTLEELQDWQIEESSAHAALTTDERPSPESRTAVDCYQTALAALAPKQSALAEVGRILDKCSKDEPLSSEDWNTVRELVSAIPGVLAMIHQAAALSPGRFPTDYSKGYALELPHLAGIRNIAWIFRAEALLAAHDGRRDDACAAIMAGITVSRPLRHEPILISQLVRIACSKIMVDALSDTMGMVKYTEAQLKQLQHAFDEAHYPLSLRNALAAERVFMTALYRDPALISGRTVLDDIVPGSTYTLMQTLRATGWFNREANQCLAFFDELIRASTLPYPEAARIFDRIGEMALQPTLIPHLSKAIIPSLVRAPESIATEKARLLQAATATAVARYELAHGAPPDLLDSLVPAYITSVPEDPFDLHPMRYRREEDSYILYSVGPNGKDDGGIRGRSEREGDLVFRPRRIPSAVE